MRKSIVNARQIRIAGAAILLLLGSLGIAVTADARDHDRGKRYDNRYNHNQYYPQRGRYVPALPRGYYPIRYRGAPYYFQGGAWYRPWGPRFVVIAPPIGIGIPLLPPFYTTVWFGSIPYYYADDTYYSWRPERREYVVTSPTQDYDTGSTAPPGNDDVFVYPKNGQSQQRLATDRYECHGWAVQQTGFDPTQPLGGVADSQAVNKRADYQRAQTACLEARGYSVK